MKLLPLVWLVAIACATSHPQKNDRHAAALPVPFIAQEKNLCGPAALAMVANYYGQDISQQEIAQSIYLPEIQGTLTTDLAQYAERFGLWVRQYRGSPGDLAQKIDTRIPLIVLGKINGAMHYFVVLEDGDPLIVHTDQRAFHAMNRSDFLGWWEAAGNWTLLVCPPDKARWEFSAAERNDLGLHYERANDPCMAEQHYRMAVELAPDNSYYQLNLGNAQLKQSMTSAAAESFRHAVKLAPQNADAANNLAWTLLQLGTDLEEAVQLSQRAAELNPAKRAWYLDTLGSIQLKLGRKSDAIASFDAALKAAPSNQSALQQTIREHREDAKAP